MRIALVVENEEGWTCVAFSRRCVQGGTRSSPVLNTLACISRLHWIDQTPAKRAATARRAVSAGLSGPFVSSSSLCFLCVSLTYLVHRAKCFPVLKSMCQCDPERLWRGQYYYCLSVLSMSGFVLCVMCGRCLFECFVFPRGGNNVTGRLRIYLFLRPRLPFREREI